ncbi:NTP transferase domain-containing protein, partial [bacterium]|nr:NTP transferase domain-containing protein [bacterium]
MTNFPIKNAGAAILAGGENRRMPVPKAFIEVDGQTIIEKSITLASSLFNEVHIVTNRPDHFSFLQTRMLGDIYDIRGPMTGILTALINTRHAWAFISARDMPLLSRALIAPMAPAPTKTPPPIPPLQNSAAPPLPLYS